MVRSNKKSMAAVVRRTFLRVKGTGEAVKGSGDKAEG